MPRLAVRAAVWAGPISRTDIDLDLAACAAMMRRFAITNVDDAVNTALRMCAEAPLSTREALELEGSGWIGELDEMRALRTT